MNAADSRQSDLGYFRLHESDPFVFFRLHECLTDVVNRLNSLLHPSHGFGDFDLVGLDVDRVIFSMTDLDFDFTRNIWVRSVDDPFFPM